MHWSWDDLKATPSWIVERTRFLLEVQEAWREQESKKRGSG